MAKKLTQLTRISDLIPSTLDIVPGWGATRQQFEAWAEEAESLFAVVDTNNMAESAKYLENHRPSGGAIIFLAYVAHEKFTAWRNIAAAKAIRKPAEREAAKALWDEWQNSPDKYASQEKFCIALASSEGCSVGRSTAGKWFWEFRCDKANPTTPQWESKFGGKYPEDKRPKSQKQKSKSTEKL